MFQLKQGEKVLRFEGEKIAFRTSELPSKDRWTEVTVFLTTFDEWVIQVTGKSRISGETDRNKFIISKDPVDVLNAILSDDVSRLAKQVIADSWLYLMDCEGS